MMPRICIANLPTPVEMMPRLSASLGGQHLWIKRDDLTGLAMGGNKIRKLEYAFAEAQSNGARTLITVGAAQSNHCRQTAALAAKMGMACILVLSGLKPEKPSANLLLDYLFGAEIIWTTRAERDNVLQQTFNDAWSAGKRPYLMPLGASNPTGVMGYKTAFDEFHQQGVNADWIILASSSGGTQAGLVLGARMANWKGKILGISIDQTQIDLQKKVAELASQAAIRINAGVSFKSDEILVNADYLGEGYGVLGQPEVEAIRLFGLQEGLLLDPVYTGRAAAGMIDLIRKGFFDPQETLLFWHTGGNTALFATNYSDQLFSMIDH